MVALPPRQQLHYVIYVHSPAGLRGSAMKWQSRARSAFKAQLVIIMGTCKPKLHLYPLIIVYLISWFNLSPTRSRYMEKDIPINLRGGKGDSGRISGIGNVSLALRWVILQGKGPINQHTQWSSRKRTDLFENNRKFGGTAIIVVVY